MQAIPYPSTPEQARHARVEYYDPKRPCPSGHLAMRTLDGGCTLCRHIEEMKADRSRT